MKRYLKKRSAEHYYKVTVILFLLLYAAVGLFMFDDYGCGPDEGMERQTSLVNLKYVIHKLHLPVSDANEKWLEYLPELHEYRDRYYGTALHFPLVLIESAFHFTLEPSQFYGMRHLYTFMNFYFGVICLYKLLSVRFHSRFYGLAGILILVFTPRFFAESFYNNKDVIFTAWYIVCCYLLDRWFRKRGTGISVLLAFALALTINTRFNGIIFIPVFICLYAADCLRKRKTSCLKQFFLVLVLIFVFFYLITPNFWEQSWKTFRETLEFNMHHPNHGSEGNLFKGILVDAAKTLTYIPVWIGITVPTIYLLFSLAGAVWFSGSSVVGLLRLKFRDFELTDMLMFITGYLAVGFIIAAHVTIYNSWRHCYFAYPCFVYFAVYFLFRLFNLKKRSSAYSFSAILLLSMIYNSIWIAANHPFEFVYFAPFIRNSAMQYSGDYWSISSRALLEYITETDSGRVLMVNHAHSQAGSINRGLLLEEKRNFLELTYDESPDVDYYIICRDDIPDVNIAPDGYEKVYSITVDQDEIGAVFKKISLSE